MSQALIEQMNIEGALDDLAYMTSLKREIAYLNGRYNTRMKQKNFEMADIINQLMGMYQRELENVTKSTSSNACEVFQAPVSRNKRLFVLER